LQAKPSELVNVRVTITHETLHAGSLYIYVCKIIHLSQQLKASERQVI